MGKLKASLFHYTDKKGLQGILKSGRILSSTNTTSDCKMGRGVYFTKKPPTCSTKALVQNNYGRTANKNSKVSCFVEYRPYDVGTTKPLEGARKVNLKPGTKGISLGRATAIGTRDARGRVTKMKLPKPRRTNNTTAHASRRRRR